MLFCFAPCVKLMFWYKISLTLTTKRASKRSDTERVFSVNSLTLTLAQSTCIRFRSAARLRPNCASSLQLGRGGGGFDLECVNVSRLGGSGGMLPGKIFNLKPSEMARNAFKLLTWCGETYILSTTKKVTIKKFSPQRVVKLL